MAKKIDLHIHSTFSDGRDTVEEIIELAKENKVEIISLTDHDLISGVDKAVDLGAQAGIKIIPGIEISTTYRGKLLHILGYFIDIRNKELLNFLNNTTEEKKKHFRAELIRLNAYLEKERRKKVDTEKYITEEDKYFSLPGVAFYLHKEGIFNGINEAFDFLEGKLKTPVLSIEPKDAFRIIKKAGGMSSLAHSLAPKVSLRKITNDPAEWEKIIADFKNDGMDGIECYGFAHSKEEIKTIIEFSKKYNFMLTAGSDWHGSFEKQEGEAIKKWLPFYTGRFEGIEVSDKIYSYFMEK
ncbi:MAG: PHP domain-containing protein [Patescibacteria group bacterium]